MATIEITISSKEKQLLDDYFESNGTTTKAAIHAFLKHSLQQQAVLPSTDRQRRINPHAIRSTLSQDDSIVLPGDIPNDVISWLKNG